jgi:multidrug efflux pump subunit AcrA (membrane-fusion protein)
MNVRRDRRSRPWLLYLLGVVAIAVAALAVSQIGPPTSSARTSRETVTAEQGVVQSSVTGSGNISAGTDDTVNFNTSGTLQDVYVHVGQHVTGGQLLADLDPTAADLQLSQAQSQLTAAEDQLTCLQDQTTANCGSGGSGGSGSGSGSSGSGSSGSGSSGSGSSGSASTTSFTPSSAGTVEYASYEPGSTSGSGKTKKPTTGSGGTPTSGSGGTPKTESGGTPKTESGGTPTESGTKVTKTTPSVTVTVVVPSTKGSSASSGASSAPKTSSTQTTTTTATPSPSSLASAQAAVYSAQAAVHTAEIAVNNTKLYAPVSGTIASLSSLTPGDTVSAGGSGSSSSSSSSSSSGSGSSGSGTSGTGGTSTAGSLGGSGSSSSSSTSSGFAEIINTDTLTMTVAFSESDISKVHDGQPATVTLDALPGVQLAAHVSSISLVGTTSSSVVSYDATLTLDQNDSRVKPGMSASASVIVGQASGVTVPNAAVTGSGSLGTVTLVKNGKDVTQQVVVGLRGDTRTQIISGVNAGDQLVITIALPSLGSTSTSGSGSGTLGGGGLGGLGGLGGGGGFFRGGGAGGGGALLRGGGGG